MWTPNWQSPHSLRRTENNRLVSHTHDIVETHGYAQEYWWMHVSAFKQGNIATVGLFRMAETFWTNVQLLRYLVRKPAHAPICTHTHTRTHAHTHTHLSCPVLSWPLEGVININLLVHGFFVCVHRDLQHSWTICGRLYIGLSPSVLPLYWLASLCLALMPLEASLPTESSPTLPACNLTLGSCHFAGLCHEPAVQVPLVSCTCALPDHIGWSGCTFVQPTAERRMNIAWAWPSLLVLVQASAS